MRSSAPRAPFVLTVIGTLFFAVAGNAQVVFQGRDPGAGPASPRPNSNAAAAAFDAAAGALGTLNLIDFESAPLGNFSALSVAPGVVATLAGTTASATDADPGITDVPGNSGLGYNTTAGGTKHLRFVPLFNGGTATATFSFADPVQAFGAFFTGLGTANGDLFVTFNDGTSQELPVAGVGSVVGGAQFFGFTDAGRSISSISLQLRNVTGSRDIFGIDDVRYVSAAEVIPEPGTFAPLAAGLLFFAAVARRRRTI